MSTTRSLGAVAAEVSDMETSSGDGKRRFQEWAERFVEDNPPPPLSDEQRDVLDVLGRHMPSLAG